MNGRTNLKVVVLDTDFYARKAINSYLAWDRRTRVVLQAETLRQVKDYVETCGEVNYPDVVLLDAHAADSPEELAALIRQIEHTIREVLTLVLDYKLDLAMLHAVMDADANGYLLRNELRVRIVAAICWAYENKQEFIVTSSVKQALVGEYTGRSLAARVVPQPQRYPELADRVREALQLTVIEGMSADLAADEMGLSPYTVRGYVRDGYRILESHDDSIYPPNMSAQERAFVRITRLMEDNDPVERR